MTFGSDLWDRETEIDEYLKENLESCLSINELLKSIAAAEEIYASTLSRVIKPYKESIKKAIEMAGKNDDPLLQARTPKYSSTLKAFDQFLQGNESISKLHEERSVTLTTERKVLKQHCKDLDEATKINWMKIKSSKAALDKTVDFMESKHISYLKELAAVENMSGVLKLKMKDKVEKAIDKSRFDLEKQLVQAKDINLQYRKSIKSSNSAKTQHFTVLVPEVLNQIQSDDETLRIEATKRSFINISKFYQEQIPALGEIWKKIGTEVVNIEATAEYQYIFSTLKTGYSVPLDFAFSDTITELKAKAVLKPSSEYENEDDDLSELDPKKAKKKALERLRVIDKEIIELEKHRISVETLAASFKDLPNPLHMISELEGLSSEFQVKINILILKKHSIHCFVALQDGRPVPIVPALIGRPVMESPVSATSPEIHAKFRNASIKESTILERCEVLYDFVADAPTDVSMKAGEFVELISLSGDGWATCINQSGATGQVPAAYIGKSYDI